MIKFLKEALTILNNQRGSMDLGEASEAETDSGSDDMTTEGLLASIESESGSEGEATAENGSSQEEVSTDGQSDLEAQLEAYEAEGQDGSNILEELNKLGILHKGMPVEFDDLDAVKEQLSKGYDYTQKTQELAEMRKEAEASITQEREAFAQERDAFQKEIEQHQQTINNYGIFQRMVADIQAKDPELFEELDRYYQAQESQFHQISNNPEVNALKQELAQLKSQLNGSKVESEEKQLSEIRQTWERDVSELQKTFGPKLRSLGIRPNWEEVKAVWTADATNQMSVKNALFAKYGEQISKAMDNKSKLAETRSKVARAGVSKEDEKQEEIFGMKSGNSYENEAFEILKTL